MVDALYNFFRGAAGFSLLAGGITLLLEPRRPPIKSHFSKLYLGTGFLFTISALDPIIHLPDEVAMPLIIGAIFVLSQALFDISVYVMGGEKIRGSRTTVNKVGLAWSVFLVVLPWLDILLGLPPISTSVEDSQAQSLFHAIVDVAIYFWPMVISIVSVRVGRWKLREFPSNSLGAKAVTITSISAALILGLVGLGLVLSSVLLYRLAHSLLQVLLLLSYFFLIHKPEAFGRMRQELRESHARTVLLSKTESESITSAIEALLKKESIYLDPALDLAMVSERLNLPPYRLSKYFNNHLKTSFPAWINTLRIQYVCKQMTLRPDATILDLAMEAGYSSKAVFNAQFSRIMGMSPSEYKRGKPR